MKPSCSPDLLNLLDAIRGASVSLWWDSSDHLHVWPVANLSADQIEALKTNKRQVIAILRQRNRDLLPEHAPMRWMKQTPPFAGTAASPRRAGADYRQHKAEHRPEGMNRE